MREREEQRPQSPVSVPMAESPAMESPEASPECAVPRNDAPSGPAPKPLKMRGVVKAETIRVPGPLTRLARSLTSPTLATKRTLAGMRLAEFAFGVVTLALSVAIDLPFSARFTVESESIRLIDAGTIQTMMKFPAYVYMVAVALVTLIGALVFLIFLLFDLSLVGGTSEHESVRFLVDNNVPFVALCFDFVFLVLAITSAFAVIGITHVMRENVGNQSLGVDLNSVGGVSVSKLTADEISQLDRIFNVKYIAAGFMIAQSLCLMTTLYLGWAHVEERKKQMTVLGIPAQATQMTVERIARLWRRVQTRVGRRSQGRVAISPLFVNRVLQVCLSLGSFVCSYVLISDRKSSRALIHVMPFQVMCWVSLAVFIISFGIAVVSVTDILLTSGGGSPPDEEDAGAAGGANGPTGAGAGAGGGGGGGGRARSKAASDQQYRGILESSGSRFKETMVYTRLVYDSAVSFMLACVFSASAGVTTADISCGTKIDWCQIAVASVFFLFVLCTSFLVSLFTGSYVEFVDMRMKLLSIKEII